MKRRARSALGWGAFLVLAGGGYYAWRQTDVARAAASLPDELAAARRAGLPTTPDELRQSIRKKTGTNAAPYFLDAFAKTGPRARKAFGGDAATVIIRNEANAKAVATAKGELRALQSALTTFTLGSKQDRLEYDRRWEMGWALLLPDLHQSRNLASALCLQALFHVKQRDSLIAAARVARLLDDDPGTMTVYARFAVERQVIQTAQRLVRDHPQDPAVRKLAREALQALGPFPDLRPKFGGELVIHRVGAQTVTSAQIGQMIRDGSSLRFPEGAMFYLRVPVVRQANEATVVRYWRELAGAMPGDPEDFAAIRDGIARVNARYVDPSRRDMMLVTTFAPFHEGLVDAVGQGLARRRILQATLDALDAHDRTGRFPATLAVTDPFGDRLRYRATAHGFTIYSLGADRTDNGGADTGKATRSDIAARIVIP